MTRVLVTGASRGLGLEFARQWVEAGRRVFGLARDPAGSPELQALAEAHPDALTAVVCDVADGDSVAAARDRVAEDVDALDVVVNNAGVAGRGDGIEDLDLDSVRRVFEINTLGPLRVTRTFLPLLRAGRKPARLIHMTSLMGSIEDNRSGGSTPYRISKCALNMASRNLAHDLADEEIVSVVLHPGWVRTDMGGTGAPLPVTDAVAALIRTIEALGMERSGGFYDREGQPLPW